MSEKTDKTEKWRQQALKTWALVGACVLIGIVIYVCQIIWQAVAVIIVTALAVFLMHGFVNRIERRGFPRWGAVTFAFVLVTAVVVGCIVALIPALTAQLTAFVNQMPAYTVKLQDFVIELSSSATFLDTSTINEALSDFSTFVRQQTGTLVSSLATGVIGGLVGLGNTFLIAFISFICSFWILLDLPTITVELRKLVNDKYQEDIDIFADAFGNAVYGWAKSTLICAVITGVVSWLVFLIMGIPYSAVLGFLCGLLYFVPYLGPMISCAIVAAIALFVSPLTCILSILACILINNIVGNIVSPKLMKTSVNVYPAIVLIAILVGSALGGIPGMLLSIPVIGAAQGVFVTYFETRTGKTLSTENGALFQKKKESGLPRIDHETGKIHLHDD